jgi:hypothetical protein
VAEEFAVAHRILQDSNNPDKVTTPNHLFLVVKTIDMNIHLSKLTRLVDGFGQKVTALHILTNVIHPKKNIPRSRFCLPEFSIILYLSNAFT